MLEYLHVKNLALLKECELNFERGLNVLTGETGAGKSVLLGSVNLALGAKADKDIIRTGCDEAYVELGFSVNDSVKGLLQNMEISCDEETVYISRKISPTKNVFKINGEIVPAKLVKELAGGLIDIHGQHEHQSLLSNARQLEMLDAFGGEAIKSQADIVKASYERYIGLKNELEEASELGSNREREMSLLKYEVQEIEEANLVEGEDEELEEAYKRMQSSEKLLEYTSEAMNMLSSEQGDDAGSLISRALLNINRVASIDETATDISDKLSECESMLGDITINLSKYMDKLEFSPEEFETTEERLNTINSLKARFGRTIKDVLKYYTEKSEELTKLENFEEYLEKLKKDTDEAYKDYDKEAGKLTTLRKNAASEFEKVLVPELLALSFSSIKFSVSDTVDLDKVSAKGRDEIEFLISTNLGEPVKPMKNVASGGELSRIMLAIKTILAARDEIDALIFDEIDTGISGRTAWEVAKKLARLSKEHQVILITHLAQIASMADSHYVIEKNVSGDKTFTEISALNEDGEIKELARLLGTDEASVATIDNARELKEKANEEKRKAVI